MRYLMLILVVAFGGFGAYALVTHRGGTSGSDTSDEGGNGVETPLASEKPPEPLIPAPPTAQKPTGSPLQSLGNPLSDGIQSIILDLIVGKVSLDDEASLVLRMVGLLEEAKLGDDQGREQAATTQIRAILRQARDASGQGRPNSESISARQKAAIQSLARNVVGDLYRRLPGAAPGARGHEGTLLAAAPDVKLPPGYAKAPWATLGGFDYAEGMKLPEALTSMDKKQVGVIGYMITLEEVEDIHEFLLVESLWSCCFGTPPEVHQVVVVKISGDRGIDFTSAPIVVLGDMSVGEEVEEGFVTSVYRVAAHKVEEVE